MPTWLSLMRKSSWSATCRWWSVPTPTSMTRRADTRPWAERAKRLRLKGNRQCRSKVWITSPSPLPTWRPTVEWLCAGARCAAVPPLDLCARGPGSGRAVTDRRLPSERARGRVAGRASCARAHRRCERHLLPLQRAGLRDPHPAGDERGRRRRRSGAAPRLERRTWPAAYFRDPDDNLLELLTPWP